MAHLGHPPHHPAGEAGHQDHRREDGERHRDDLDPVGPIEGSLTSSGALSRVSVVRRPHRSEQLSERGGELGAAKELRLQPRLELRRPVHPDLEGRSERRQPLGDQLLEAIEGFPMDLVDEAGIQLREVAPK